MGAQKAKAIEDERIIGTNDYSIISKRSVEKLYLSDEPEFLRPFVRKFKRRAPLINRGYWLRMKAIEHVVKQFLETPIRDGKGKAVVNLGCGYDPLPFRMRWKYPDRCHNVKFIDVDFSQLIEKKVDVLRTQGIYKPQSTTNGDDHEQHPQESPSLVYTDGDGYCAVGCDLENIDALQDFIVHAMKPTSPTLFIAEVSITYMPTTAADALIKWAGSFENSRFCLLEQYLPDGPGHPFARTMLDHFSKSAPLKSTLRYSSLESQRQRFQDAGWPRVRARNLWTLWQDSMFLSDEDRTALDTVEPFDEWEEFALFAGHYMLLVAGTDAGLDVEQSIALPKKDSITSTPSIWPSTPAAVSYNECPRGQGLRRFGAVTELGANTVAFHGGQTCSAHQLSTDVYSCTSCYPAWTEPPQTLICHTITQFNAQRKLLVGGRTSPTKASSKCWLSGASTWARVAELSPGRYRHCAVPVQHSDLEGVLVFGGKMGNGAVLDEWALWTEQDGWQILTQTAESPKARFGANMTVTQNQRSCNGIILGGMSKAGKILTDVWKWELAQTDKLEIRCRELRELDLESRLTICRFGATITPSLWGSLLVGGVTSTGVLQHRLEMIILMDDCTISILTFQGADPFLRPLLIGHGAIRLLDYLLIVGGGAVCFSFGSFWNNQCYFIRSEAEPDNATPRHYVTPNPDKLSNERTKQNGTVLEETKGIKASAYDRLHASTSSKMTTSPIPATTVDSADDFSHILDDRSPIIITDCNLGPCTTLWTLDYLASKIVPSRPVTIHTSTTRHLSFRSKASKNFIYETQPFSQFIHDAAAGNQVYLRSISSTQPSKLPANFDCDFPEIASDFVFPDAMAFAKKKLHSSVLRISGDVNMWLHYDVMDNILCQIQGSKRVILFPPSDVGKLGFAPGETTSGVDVFDSNGVEGLGDTHPLEAELKEGEVMFIPACWPHATAPASGGGLSVAVNVFFRSLDAGYAVGRDVYGNRDLAAYEEGRRDLLRIVPSLNRVAQQERHRLVDALERVLQGEKVEAGQLNVDRQVLKEIAKIRNRLRTLPPDLEEFYRLRLVDELRNCMGEAL